MIPLMQVADITQSPGAMLGGGALAFLVIKEAFAFARSARKNGVSVDSDKIGDIKQIVIQTKESAALMLERQKTTAEIQNKTADTLREISITLSAINATQSRMLDMEIDLEKNIGHWRDQSLGSIIGMQTSIKTVSDKFDDIERQQRERYKK